MPSTNLTHLQSAYAVWHAEKGHDIDPWRELIGEPFHLASIDETSPGLSFATPRHSKDETVAYLAAILDDWDMVHYTPETFVEEGDRIAMFGRCAWRNKQTGKVADCRIACLWRFEGDKAVELTEIFDTARAVAAAVG